MTRDCPVGGPDGLSRGPSRWKTGLNQSAHHSHALPDMLRRP